MGRIQSSIGLITGTDIAGTVDQLMAINARPRDRVAARNENLRAQQDSLAELTASVIGVQLSGNRLGQVSTFRTKSVTSSRSEALSAVAGNRAIAGTHTVRTLQTAATHTVASRQRFDSDAEALGISGKLSINPGGFLDQSFAVSDLNNGRGVEAGSIRITDRGGRSAAIDLTKVKTVDDVLAAINDADVDVRATTEGGKIKLVDQTGQTTSNLIVEQLGDAETAADLGLWGIDVAANQASGFDLTFQVDADTSLSELRQNKGVRLSDGDDLTIELSDGTAFDVDFGDFGGNEPTIHGVLDKLNSLDPTRLTAAFTDKGIEVVDLTDGSGQFSISDAAGSSAASDLGLIDVTSSDTITAPFEKQVLRGTSLGRLAGGDGISGLTDLDITTSDGSSASIDLSGAATTAEVLDAINGSGLKLIARLNEAGTGIRIRDVSGGENNLVISSVDDTAAQLGIAANTGDSIVSGANLARQNIDERTPLSSLNRGVGVNAGSFTITDSNGTVSAVNLKSEGILTVGDLVDAINGLGADVTASIAPNGDGIAIVDNAGGDEMLTITDVGSGTAAADLGIAGTAVDRNIGGETVSALVGSQSDTIDVEATDSLSSIVEKINASERYATASVITNDDGTYSLRLRSNAGGAAGRLAIETDGFDLDLDTIAKAQDAIIAVSTDGGTERLLTSSDGVFNLDGDTNTSQTVTALTKLTDFASGAGSGSFTITDSAGKISAVNLTVQDITTVGQLVDTINSLGLGVSASINEDATGISIVDTAGGDKTLTITDVGGSAATALGVAGEADEVQIGGLTVSALQGTGQSNAGADESTGLTFTLKQLSDDPIVVDVAKDSSAAVKAAETFVNQYNLLVDKLDSLTFFNAETNEVG